MPACAPACSGSLLGVWFRFAGSLMRSRGWIRHTVDQHLFKDQKLFYNLVKPSNAMGSVRGWAFEPWETCPGAHHLFLSDESLYLLVWDQCLDDEQEDASDARVQKWIDCITSAAPSASVLLFIVCNKVYAIQHM